MKMMNQKKKRQRMSKKHDYRSMQDIKMARAELRYESRLLEEKFKYSGDQLFSNFSYSLKSLSFNIRNKLLTIAFFRSLSKSGMVYDFFRNFARGFRRAR